MNWEEALHYCEELDSDLIELTTRSQHEFVRRNVQRDSWLNAASDRPFEYIWKNSDRKLANHFTNWHPLEPGCARCCVKLHVSESHYWHAENCVRSNAPICVRDVRSTARLLRKLRPHYRPSMNPSI